MATYLILNILVLIGLTALTGRILAKLRTEPLLLTLGILLLLTAVFDSLIIAVDLVAYDPSKILGFYIGKAPIEDFAYTIAAVMLIPYVWKRLEKDA